MLPRGTPFFIRLSLNDLEALSTHWFFSKNILGEDWSASQRSLHNEPIFRLLLKVAVKGTQQCEFLNFCGDYSPMSVTILCMQGVWSHALLLAEMLEYRTPPAAFYDFLPVLLTVAYNGHSQSCICRQGVYSCPLALAQMLKSIRTAYLRIWRIAAWVVM